VTEAGLRRRIVPPVLLLAVLAAAILLQPVVAPDLGLGSPDRTRVDQLRATFDSLPDRALVVVGMDADMGTYPEIRVTARAAFDDLLGRGARLAFVSFSTEGRAVSAAEQARLRDAGTPAGAVLDLGYVAGAEAGLVRAVTDVLPVDASGPQADAIEDAGGGLAAFSMALVVSGADLGARSWVEQVGTRLPDLPMVAIAPTFMLPELQPYLRTGQLSALLASVRDGAAYAEATGATNPADVAAGDRPPSALAMLIGMLIAAGTLGRLVARGLVDLARAARGART
jgi:hypothetical protein